MAHPNHHLKHERQLRGWSQAYLAQQVGAPHPHYISRWERGEALPTPFYQQKLCEFFGKSAEELGFLPPASAPLEPTRLPSHIASAERDPLRMDVLRRPSSLLVVAVSRSWMQRRIVPLVLVLVLLLSLVVNTSVNVLQSSGHSVGSFSFSNTGLESANASAGMAAEIALHVHLGAQPITGKRYYAWLLPDQNNPEGMIVPLGTLSPQGDLIYRDPASTNLLLSHSTVLITEQRSSPVPHVPSLDQADWRFQGVIDQQHAPGTLYSLLDHVRHLFAIDPEVEAADLHGGLVSWLSYQTRQLATLAKNAQKQQQNGYASHQDLLRMLEDLDGTTTVAQDLPGISFPINPQAKIGLLTVFPEQSHPGYVQHIENHLRGMTTSPGVSQQQQILANQSLVILDGLTTQLQQAREMLLHLLKNGETPLLLENLVAEVLHALDHAQQVTTSLIRLLTFPLSS